MSDYLRCWRRKPLVQFDWCPYEKEKFGRTHRHVIMKAEMGGCGRDQGIPKLAGTPPEARGRAWNAFPLGLRRSQPCCHFGPGVWSPELRDVTFLLSKPPVCGALPRPPWAAHTLGEADTVHGQTCRPVVGSGASTRPPAVSASGSASAADSRLAGGRPFPWEAGIPHLSQVGV